ncbi:MAG: BASS family bile acid:Na+ symporter, partial [Bradymonadia bacterium]
MDPGLIQDIFATTLVVSVMLGVGLDVDRTSLRALVKQWPILLRAGAFNHVLVPIVAWGIAEALGVPQQTKLAMLLIASVPGGPVGSLLVRHGRGDLALSVALVITLGLTNTIATPLSLSLLGVEADRAAFFAATLRTVFGVVVLPLLVGQAIRGASLVWAGRVSKVATMLANVLLVGLIVGMSALNGHLITEFDGRTIAAMAALMIFCLGGGALIGGRSRPIQAATGLTGGVRNIALALLLAPRMLDDYGQLVVLLYPLFVLILASSA